MLDTGSRSSVRLSSGKEKVEKYSLVSTESLFSCWGIKSIQLNNERMKNLCNNVSPREQSSVVESGSCSCSSWSSVTRGVIVKTSGAVSPELSGRWWRGVRNDLGSRLSTDSTTVEFGSNSEASSGDSGLILEEYPSISTSLWSWSKSRRTASSSDW